jgi:arsenate reductase
MTCLYGLRNCDSVRKARAWLQAHGIEVPFHDFRAEGLEPDRLRRWCEAVGWERLLNRAGTTFRGLPEAQRQAVDAERAFALMLAQPAMIKRPVLEHDGQVLVGFDADRYGALWPLVR